MAPKALRYVLIYRRLLLVIIVPLLLCPLPIAVKSKEAAGAFIVLLMGIYWLTEALPYAVTSFLPVILAPAFQILESKKICPSYMKDTNFLFLGGLTVAHAMERWNVHRRIALLCMMLTGTSPRRVMIGMMLPTWFLSMWISNTAATAMMIPMMDAVLQEMKMQVGDTGNANLEMKDVENEKREDHEDDVETTKESEVKLKPGSVLSTEDKKIQNFSKALFLSIAYAASCGGIATLTGTPPNLVLNSQILSHEDWKTNFGFGTWMGFALPISFLAVVFVWVWLQLWFMGPREFVSCKSDPERDARVKKVIREHFKELGPVSFGEGSTMVFFALLIFMWISKKPGVNGWIAWFIGTRDGKSVTFAGDAQPAVLIATIMFFWPARNPFQKTKTAYDMQGDERPTTEKPSRSSALLSWGTFQREFPWGIVFLLGGGFALQDICEHSGLSRWIGQQLRVLDAVPLEALILIIVGGSAIFTEFASNTAAASILLPILSELGICIKVNPLFLMIPATVGCSLAFCLPVATPPNAIVFSKGVITIPDMFKAGLVLNLVCILLVTGCTLSYMGSVFGMPRYSTSFGTCANSTTG